MTVHALIQRVRPRRAGWAKYRVTVYRTHPTTIVPICRSRPLRYSDALIFARQHAAEIVHDDGELLALANDEKTTNQGDTK